MIATTWSPGRHTRVVCLALIASLGLASAASSGPITFSSAITLAPGELVLREQFVFDRASDDPSAANREFEAIGVVSVLGYAVSRDLMLFAVLPYFDKRLELTVGGARRARSDAGIGDLRLFGRYTVWRRNWLGATFRVSPFAGLETPTGDDNERDAFGRLPAAVQLGSGSWDPFGGIVATYQTLDFQIDAAISYQANIRANGFEFGDVARLDASFQYRLWPRPLGPGLPAFLYGVLEANLIHQGNNERGGIEDANSGGTRLFLVPGLQYVTKRWIVEAAVQVPLLQALNGAALQKDFVVRAGFRVNF